jgi:hypothetical protein
MKQGYLSMAVVALVALVISLMSANRIVKRHRMMIERETLSLKASERQEKNTKDQKRLLTISPSVLKKRDQATYRTQK